MSSSYPEDMTISQATLSMPQEIGKISIEASTTATQSNFIDDYWASPQPKSQIVGPVVSIGKRNKPSPVTKLTKAITKEDKPKSKAYAKQKKQKFASISIVKTRQQTQMNSTDTKISEKHSFSLTDVSMSAL